jgi:enamine deaminase RidA (YjgF/YER057c/UK114 family)
MGAIETRLMDLGLELPAPPRSLGRYTPAKRVGQLIVTSGMVPVADGEPIHVGKVGAEVSMEQARECAVRCVLNGLAAVKEVVGDLGRVEDVVELRGFVSSAPGFVDQPQVLDAASGLLVALFGEVGRPARLAIGVSELPLNVPVELAMTVRVQ